MPTGSPADVKRRRVGSSSNCANRKRASAGTVGFYRLESDPSPGMSDPLLWHRLQFAFTIIYHYLFPQLTMGLALLIVVLKAIGLATGRTTWDDAARFWIRIFGLNFAMGVATGVPMEFQFGTNWARFSEVAGG